MSKTEISKPEMSVNDQFLVQVELAAERLASFQHDLQSLPASQRVEFDERRHQIEDRCHVLGEHIMGWPEVRIGTASK